MKEIRNLLVGAICACGLATGAQTPSAGTQPTAGQPALPAPTEFSAVLRDTSSTVWERTVYEPGPNGSVVGQKHRYTELATSLNVRDPQTGQYHPADETIDLLPDGTAAATQCEHQVYFPIDIAQGVIRMVLPSGQQLQSRPIALVLDDGSRTAVIAFLTNSVGELTASNEVTYPNAFEGVTASLRFKNTKAGLEQDVVIEGQFPSSPGALGLDEAKTTIGVLTEFFDTADPVQTPGPVNPSDGSSDPTFMFGTVEMAHGRAFFIGGSSNDSGQNGQSRWTPAAIGSTPTYKSWIKLNGLPFLLEQIPYAPVAPQLEQLPPATGRLNVSSTNLFAANSF